MGYLDWWGSLLSTYTIGWEYYLMHVDPIWSSNQLPLFSHYTIGKGHLSSSLSIRFIRTYLTCSLICWIITHPSQLGAFLMLSVISFFASVKETFPTLFLVVIHIFIFLHVLLALFPICFEPITKGFINFQSSWLSWDRWFIEFRESFTQIIHSIAGFPWFHMFCVVIRIFPIF